jgi:DNA (cytosine-5)-methyltransferase 1
VLDAQYFGVAQRRKRVFVIGYLGDWKPAAEILFESESLSRNTEKGRKTREEIAGQSVPSVANCIQTTCNDYSRADGFNMIAVGAFGKNISDTVTAKFAKGAELLQQGAQNGGNCVLQPIPTKNHSVIVVDRSAFNQGKNALYNSYIENTEIMPTLISKGPHAVAFGWQNSSHQGISLGAISPTLDKSKTPAVFCDTYNGTIQGDISATLTADMAGPTHSGPKVMQNIAVRRLTPVECERLQGFPDNYTNIPKAADGNRYKALGNSMAVPVMRWIGERINQYEQRGVEKHL